jgi:hypothetical protein
MIPASTKHEFLRLRAQGQSLAAIARRLHISKPTAIKWNREALPGIAAQAAAERQRVHQEVAQSTADEIADLTRKLTGLKQELFSRAVREHPTALLEKLAGDLRHRLDKLNHVADEVTSRMPQPIQPPVGDEVTSRTGSEPIRT